MKSCLDCGLSKTLDEFPKNKAKPDGRHYYCRACVKSRNDKYRARKPSPRIRKPSYRIMATKPLKPVELTTHYDEFQDVELIDGFIIPA